jgi:hypothetical protein
MKIFITIIALLFIVQAQKRFTSDYFISKYNLSLPEVTQKMLEVSELTHTSDLWEYFYQEKTDKIDSVVRNMTIERFNPSRRVQRYNYKPDSVIVREVSVSKTKGDTLNNWITAYSKDFRFENALDLETNCFWQSRFDDRGIKLLDVRKCQGENDFDGQVFHLNTKDDYLEKYRNKNGEIDSNSIRLYYLTSFDSIAADFMVMKGKKPFIVRLNTYNKKRKKQYSYGFGIFSNINEVLSFNYYTYTDKNQLHRSYYFDVIDRKAKEKSYELVNYTEYEYDSLGRKIRVTTRVKPDVKEPDTEDKKK